MSITARIVNGITAMSEIKIRYKEENQIKEYQIQPHLFGNLKSTGNLVLSAYDTSDKVKASWKTFLLSKIISAEVTDKSFDTTAPNYNPQDSRMETIISSIPQVE